MSRVSIIIISCLLFIVLCLGGFYFYLESEVQKPFQADNKENITKTFKIEEKSGLREIAKNLKNEGLIKSDIAFVYYVLKNNKDHLKDGYYCLSPVMTISEIVETMEEEQLKEEIKITFPEGFRLSQIEERLENYFQQFSTSNLQLSDFKTKNFKNQYGFLSDAPDEANLEGYLFPDTYLFYCFEPEVSCESGKPVISKCGKGDLNAIVQKFLTNFDKKLTSELREEIQIQGKSVFEIITMASILEKEVQTPDDKKIVSGIFWKRIKDGIPLQSCATIAYVLNEGEWTFSEMQTAIAKNKDIESAYNTYKYKGLPIGPISNPGIDAIKAAIFPEFTDYNYFLTDPVSGKTIFSKTLEEHNQNIVKYF
ncbi:MAG TPA: endolytic transglycosylase MltG [Candidatus Pacearchaeota archaeon]|nr:endolytic transglycosylase MltG [Candidatus Pacearchaeota archaeon]HPZ74354.1 endolytic transglycosylase MltG [Candidatus Pacearchaeota archaeon]HQD89042.1 endolytic transglycosylase MltG [Candidatus Pacearchaeota archaeon]